MPKRKFKLGDTVFCPKYLGNDITGKIVEINTFKPDGKTADDFEPGLYGSFTCGVVWENSKSAIYHFEKNLI